MRVLAVNWTIPARLDLQDAWEFVAAQNEPAADRMVDLIEKAVERLTLFPALGRPGKLSSTREWTVPDTPYRIVYQVTNNSIEIRRIIHSARDWPPKRRRS